MMVMVVTMTGVIVTAMIARVVIAMVVTMTAMIAMVVAMTAMTMMEMIAMVITRVAMMAAVEKKKIMGAATINKHEQGDRTGHQSGGFTIVELLVALSVLAILVVLMAQVINQVAVTMTRASEHAQSDSEADVVFGRLADDIAQVVNRPDLDSLFIGMPTDPSGTVHNDQMFFYTQGSGFSTNSANQSPVTLVSYLVTNQALKRMGVARSWDDQSFITPSNSLTGFNGSSPLTNFGRAANYFHVIGPSVFRMEVALLMEPGSTNSDGTTNGNNSYAYISGVTNPWHGLTNVASIVVALGVLDQTSRKILTDQQLSNLAAAFPDAITNGGIPIVNWASNQYSVAGIPRAALSQVRIYQHSFPVTR